MTSAETCRLFREGAAVPAGMPIAGTAVFIAAELSSSSAAGSLDVLPAGSVGEVCIAGVGVAAGYLRCPAPLGYDCNATQHNQSGSAPTTNTWAEECSLWLSKFRCWPQQGR